MLILKINKTQIGDRIVPDFEIREGEIASILIDKPSFEFELKDYLTGKLANDKIKIFQPLIFADYLSGNYTWIAKIRRRHSVQRVIRQELNCNDNKIQEILNKAEITFDSKIDRLAGNPRRILSTLIAFEKNKNVIYTTIGMDPLGIERLNRIVRDEVRFKKGAAIEINSPYIDGQRQIQDANIIVNIENTRP